MSFHRAVAPKNVVAQSALPSPQDLDVVWRMVEDHRKLRGCDTQRRRCKAPGGLKSGGGGEDGRERRDLDETDCEVGLSVFPQRIDIWMAAKRI